MNAPHYVWHMFAVRFYLRAMNPINELDSTRKNTNFDIFSLLRRLQSLDLHFSLFSELDILIHSPLMFGKLMENVKLELQDFCVIVVEGVWWLLIALKHKDNEAIDQLNFCHSALMTRFQWEVWKARTTENRCSVRWFFQVYYPRFAPSWPSWAAQKEQPTNNSATAVTMFKEKKFSNRRFPV